MITIKSNIGKAKYKQIVNSIEDAIAAGVIKNGDRLPSINAIKEEHALSRDTVLMAFNELKNRGIIQSIVGKGYFVSSEDIHVKQKIFLLFDELNAFKEDLYNSFLEQLGENIHVDIFFHHFNKDIFSKLIYDNIGAYNYYVIMPANLSDTNSVIKNLPSGRVYILDQIHDDLAHYAAIYQNFEDAIYQNLSKVKHLIHKYDKLVLVFPKDKQPIGMLKGFQRFCETYKLPNMVINSAKHITPSRGEVYIIPDDKNLLYIIKPLKSKNLSLAKDVGVISYNDSLLKEIVCGGITTISTDFNSMGQRLAKMILNKEHKQIENPNNLIIRNSL
ncbi:GntR family transcriptional regulator [Aestuariivivens sediminis]|uniref:GntR family transcriptional regulator n=1 Tax=Aestuariivivens sediminis TaxID=2913557 RepID=UPI001F574957|nr:GntR family transcriptional regulator [Aestuariivivens sediminis]